MQACQWTPPQIPTAPAATSRRRLILWQQMRLPPPWRQTEKQRLAKHRMAQRGMQTRSRTASRFRMYGNRRLMERQHALLDSDMVEAN